MLVRDSVASSACQAHENVFMKVLVILSKYRMRQGIFKKLTALLSFHDHLLP